MKILYFKYILKDDLNIDIFLDEDLRLFAQRSKFSTYSIPERLSRVRVRFYTLFGSRALYLEPRGFKKKSIEYKF